MADLQIQHEFNALLHSDRSLRAMYREARKEIREQIKKAGPARKGNNRTQAAEIHERAMTSVILTAKMEVGGK